MNLFQMLAGGLGGNPLGGGQEQTGLQRLLQPEMLLAMGSGMMGNQGNFQNLGQGFANMVPVMMQQKQNQKDLETRNRTLDYFKANAPEYAAMIEGGIEPSEAWTMYHKQRMEKNDPYKAVGGHIYDTSTGTWISPPESATASAPRYSLQPIYGTDEQGNTVLGTVGEDGSFRRIDTGGFTPSAGIDKIDVGTEYLLYDKKTGQMVGRQPKQNYDEAFEKGRGAAEGKAQGEAAASLPTDLATVDQTLTELETLMKHPGIDEIAGPLDQMRPGWTMSGQGRDALARFEQAKGRAFLQAFGMLKGGGQITEIEGRKAEQAMARMDRALNETEFKQALQDFYDAVKAGRDKLRQRAGAGAGAAPGPAPAAGGGGGYRILGVE